MTEAFVLTARDAQILAFLAKHKAAPLDVVAEQFFRTSQLTRKLNKNPMAACERRLHILQRQGFIDLESIRERGNEVRTRVASLRPKSMQLLEGRGVVRQVHGRARDHHHASLRAVLALQARLEARGYVVENVQLEHDIRAHVQKGTAQKLGDTFESFPDAALTMTAPDGGRAQIAVEYVTSKYTDADILAKAKSFARTYARVEWVTDTAATARRITRLTGLLASSQR